MGNNSNVIKMMVASVGTCLAYLFGAWDIPLQILLLFIVLDYGTGVLRGYINKELSSSVGARGLAKKAVIFVVLIVAVALDRLLDTGNWLFRTAVAYTYIANEGISILENCSALGLPVPKKLIDALAQLKEGEKKGKKNK